MRITWVTRSFLDYRIPVFEELHHLCGNNLSVVYYRDIVPERVQEKLKKAIGEDHMTGLTGELRFSGKKSAPESSIKRKGIRIPWQPGLLDAILKSEPEVMVSDGFFQWTYAPLLLRLWKHIPHVMCYEPTAHTEKNAQWYRTLYRKFAAHGIDAICCNGILCKEYTLTLGIPEQKIFVGNMAADSEALQKQCEEISDEEQRAFRKKSGWENVVFLYVGRLVELKGLLPLLKAWKTAEIQGTLVLAGDGEERPRLEEYCRENQLKNVFFAGAVDYSGIALYYRSADVFIIPTLRDNWSLVVPEAMACGLPVACSKYNGCYPELVKQKNGWVFDPLNSEEMVKMLKEIQSKQKDVLNMMGKQSEKIVEFFTPANAAQSVYNACVYAQRVVNKRFIHKIPGGGRP